MHIRIRRSDCCGHGQCAEVAPDIFALDSSHKAVVLDSGAMSRDTLLEAAEVCPCQAIEVEDDEGNAVFP
jgi:ferredoxin